MALRNKTLLIIGLTLGALIVALGVILGTIVTRLFVNLETEFVKRNVTRAEEALLDEINKVNRNVGDWAPWDDTYFFVQPDVDDETFQAYIGNNLYEDVFGNLDINVMLFFNADGEDVYAQSFDTDNWVFVEDESTAISAHLLDHIAGNDTLIRHESAGSSLQGFILLPEYPTLVASQPILRNDGSGYPGGGTLIMARYLDAGLIDTLAARTKLDVEIRRLDEGELPADIRAAQVQLASQDEGAIFVEALEGGCFRDGDPEQLSEDCIAGYEILNDLYGEPGLIMRVAIPRDILQSWLNTFQLFGGVLVGVGLVFIVLTLVIIERLVLVRLARLSHGVDDIGASGDLNRRLEVDGTDELAGLAKDINKMLQDLQDSLNREKQLTAEIAQLRIEIDLVKQQQQVAEITETDFFADVQAKAEAIRRQRRGTDKPVEAEEETQADEEKDG
jgi:sensor domain CHASE-containing protein/HAMP domain-containing protein